MKIGLNPKASDVFVGTYLFATLLIRFFLEPQISAYPLISIGLGVFALLFLWALSRTSLLNPTWFGLLKIKKES